jgi:membrane protein implicated in regulation of membrane protease activity
MKFEKRVSYTLDDYIAFNLFFMKKRLILTPVLFIILFPLAILVIELIGNSPSWLFMLLTTLIIAIVLAGLMTLFSIFSVRRAARKQYQSSKAMQAGSDLVMDDAGVRETSEFGSMVIKWEDIFKVMESDSAYYVFFSRMQAFLIPKRLISPDEDATLRALIGQHIPAEKDKMMRRS